MEFLQNISNDFVLAKGHFVSKRVCNEYLTGIGCSSGIIDRREYLLSSSTLCGIQAFTCTATSLKACTSFTIVNQTWPAEADAICNIATERLADVGITPSTCKSTNTPIAKKTNKQGHLLCFFSLLNVLAC